DCRRGRGELRHLRDDARESRKRGHRGHPGDPGPRFDFGAERAARPLRYEWRQGTGEAEGVLLRDADAIAALAGLHRNPVAAHAAAVVDAGDLVPGDLDLAARVALLLDADQPIVGDHHQPAGSRPYARTPSGADARRDEPADPVLGTENVGE